MVVDILRFTTAVDVAVAQGAQVVPAGWPVREGPGSAEHNVSRAVPRLSGGAFAQLS